MIIDLIITVSRDSNAFAAEAMVNFKWGGSAIVKERDFGVNAAIDRMIDKLEVKITKEKEKNQGRQRTR
jgi:putative sigma-54 modulation protein